MNYLSIYLSIYLYVYLAVCVSRSLSLSQTVLGAFTHFGYFCAVVCIYFIKSIPANGSMEQAKYQHVQYSTVPLFRRYGSGYCVDNLIVILLGNYTCTCIFIVLGRGQPFILCPEYLLYTCRLYM